MNCGEALLSGPAERMRKYDTYWVAVKELNVSDYIGETLLTTIYIYIPGMAT